MKVSHDTIEVKRHWKPKHAGSVPFRSPSEWSFYALSPTSSSRTTLTSQTKGGRDDLQDASRSLESSEVINMVRGRSPAVLHKHELERM